MSVALAGGGKQHDHKGKKPLVEVAGKFLYQEDLLTALPLNLSAEDSVLFAENYIRNWVEDVLLFDKAENNVRDGEKVKALVENYRKSLLMHAYQEELKTLHTILKPKFFVPVHGEFRHLKAHAERSKKSAVSLETALHNIYKKVYHNGTNSRNYQVWSQRLPLPPFSPSTSRYSLAAGIPGSSVNDISINIPSRCTSIFSTSGLTYFFFIFTFICLADGFYTICKKI